MKFNIVPFEESLHKEGLLKLWREELSLKDGKRFEWLYKKNPAGPPTTFIATESQTNNIVGCASVFPREILFNGQIEKITIAADFAVKKKYRVFGPAIPLQKAIIEFLNSGTYLLNFGYPNKAGEGIFQRIGYQHIGYSQAWSKILRINSKLDKKINNTLISSMLSVPVNSILWLTDIFKLTGDKKFVLKEISDYNNQFDALWQQNKRLNKQITGVRSKEYLKWRSGQPDKHILAYGLYQKNNNSLIGYVTYCLKKETVLIQDIFALPDGETLKRLFRLFIKQMRKQHKEIIYISYFGNKQLPDILKKFHFIPRPQKRSCIAYLPEQTGVNIDPSIFKTNTYWYLLDSEMDL